MAVGVSNLFIVLAVCVSNLVIVLAVGVSNLVIVLAVGVSNLVILQVAAIYCGVRGLLPVDSEAYFVPPFLDSIRIDSMLSATNEASHNKVRDYPFTLNAFQSVQIYRVVLLTGPPLNCKYRIPCKLAQNFSYRGVAGS